MSEFFIVFLVGLTLTLQVPFIVVSVNIFLHVCKKLILWVCCEKISNIW